MTDREVRLAVEQELEWDPSIDARHIGVAVADGIVSLTGHVDSYPEKHEAEQVVSRVRGVQAVVVQLVVGVPDRNLRTDEEIARAAADSISWNIFIPGDRVKISVERGRITLTGTVDYHFQRLAADQSVRFLRGVTDVNNHIAIHIKVDGEVVRDEIEAALLRNAELDAHGIRVETHGDRVVLSGNVQSWPEREEAERAAWGCPGVLGVENHLAVVPAAFGV